MTFSMLWLLAVSGALLFWMAILNVIQRRPRNRFAWGYPLSRAIVGITLIAIGASMKELMIVKKWIYWMWVLLSSRPNNRPDSMDHSSSIF